MVITPANMDPKYTAIFKNNKIWAEEQLSKDPQFFVNLAKDQTPDFLYIGCSDSRVHANEITGLALGDLFVHRNIANLVDSTDMNCQSVIQYAVETLRVKHIVICGHYGCGGVRAAMRKVDQGLIDGWLRNIRDIYRIHQEELDRLDNEKKQYERLVEINAIEQAMNILKIGSVQRRLLKEGFPKVHAWVYDINTGLLKDLKHDFQSELSGFMKIYKLEERHPEEISASRILGE